MEVTDILDFSNISKKKKIKQEKPVSNLNKYDVKKEAWQTCEEADFYSFGGLKTIRNLNRYLVTWDFDDRGNVIRVEWISDGETNQIYEYEYTYYTASSEAGGL